MPLEPTKLLAEIEKRYEETSKQRRPTSLYMEELEVESHTLSQLLLARY